LKYIYIHNDIKNSKYFSHILVVMFKRSAKYQVQRLFDVRDTKMRSCLREEKELARILMQYRRSRYGCAPSTCSKSPLSNLTDLLQALLFPTINHYDVATQKLRQIVGLKYSQ
jgi:hypothetical protein